MKNKLRVLIAASMLPLSTFAAYSAHEMMPSLEGSWYGGINVGINAVSIDKTLTHPVNDVSPTVTNYQSAYNNVHAQLFAGFAWPFQDKMSVAIEGDADWFVGKASYQQNNWFGANSASGSEQLSYGFGLFALPSYQLSSNTKFFVGPGVHVAKFKTESGSTGGNLGITGSSSKWLNAWAVKAGLFTALTDTIDLVFSYQHNRYGKLDKVTTETLSQDSLRGVYQPTANIGMLGLSYHA